jgi:tRNA 2-selenouridine synthase
MIQRLSLTTPADLAALPAGSLIDARAPAEFADDHIPGAISLPVLDDAQRAEVGTLYAQVSPFAARKIGGALVAQNVAGHLQGPLADRAKDWSPVVYCWRGGQRSGAFATILSQVGWPVRVIDGGYRAYRRLVVEQLYKAEWPFPVVLLDGGTGVGKTALLAQLHARGVACLDLEGAANHRGSIFGAMGAQPSQKAMESAICAQLAGVAPGRPLVVEAESYKIGRRIVPPSLWAAMTRAPRVVVSAPVAARAAYSVAEYASFATEERMGAALDGLAHLHPRAVLDDWRAMAAQGAFTELAQALITQHYDPGYARQERGDVALRVEMADLSEAAMIQAADQIAQQVEGIVQG